MEIVKSFTRKKGRFFWSSRKASTVSASALWLKPDDFENFISILVFYNPESGGRKTKLFKRVDEQTLWYQDKSKRIFCALHFWDISKEASREEGFYLLKDLLSNSEAWKLFGKPQLTMHIKIIVAGGDGTVVWCLQELIKRQIPFETVSIGVIPYGTGNDLSRVLHWNCRALQSRLNFFLKVMIPRWIEAIVIPHDIWRVTIELDSNLGVFQKVNSSTKQKEVLKEWDEHSNCFNKKLILSLLMSNYFSIGVESRIGIGFDKHRGTNLLVNKLRYLAEGVKKSFFKRTLLVNQLLHSMTTYNFITNESKVIFCCPKQKINYPGFYSKNYRLNNKPLTNFNKVLSFVSAITDTSVQRLKTGLDYFSSKDEQNVCTKALMPAHNTRASEEQQEDEINLDRNEIIGPILKDCSSLVALNIPSFAAGLNLWKINKFYDYAVNAYKGLQQNQFNLQKLGDKQLEFLSFSKCTTLGFERIAGGFAKKVYQGAGPFNFAFHPLHKNCRVYFQVDGEFYVMRCPKQIKITRETTAYLLANPRSPYRKNYSLKL